jgi:lipopolysaccharide cholinephosphotransferase
MAITLEDLKKVRPYQLKALQHIHDTCEKHGLKYTLWAGTALGAVRHKGFIPWDADVDVALLRPDFEKLKEVFLEQNGKGTGFFFESQENTPDNYVKFHPILKVDGTYFATDATKNINVHHGIYIDIFPIDIEPCNNFKKFLLKRITILKFLAGIRNTNFKKIQFSNFYPSKVKQGVGNLLRFVLKMVPDKMFYLIYNMFLKLASMENGEYFVSLATGYSYKKGRFKKEIFNSFEDVVFENHKFSLMKNYDLYLSELYGDYMKVPNQDDPICRSHLLERFELKLID